MNETTQKIVDMLVTGGMKVIIACIVIIVSFRLSTIIVNSIRKGKKFSKIDKNVQGFSMSFLSILIKAIGLLIAASLVGIPTTSLITVVGSAGVAIGLALQGGLSNIAGGIMILLFKPFSVGDYVDTYGGSGTVRKIELFYTQIVTPDNKKIMLPNGDLSNNPITNYSSMKTRRVDLKISVAYDSNIEKVKSIIEKVIKVNELVLQEEEVLIRVREHAASALTFDVRVWASQENYWTVYYDLMEDIKEAFDKNKIEIPYNQLDVKIKK